MLNILLVALLTAMLPASTQKNLPPVGSVAPDFTLADDRGHQRALSEFRGKTVVLEWHEKGCPYVTKHYRGGQMQKLQRQWLDRGVVWLLLSSSAEGAHSYLTAEQSR